MRPWTVTPHSPLVEHEPNLWSVESPVPGIKGMNRRMTLAKLSDGRIVFFNAIPLDDAALAKVRAWGKPWLLVVPHRAHMIDAEAFREKLGLTVCCPDVELAKVRARVPSAVAMSSITLEPGVRLDSFLGAKLQEPRLTVVSGPRTSVAISDVVMNVITAPLSLRLMGFTGGPKVVPVQKLIFVKSKKVLADELDQVAALPGLTRVLCSHGEVIEGDVPGILRGLAAGLR